MSDMNRTIRRGLSMLELMIALAVTALIGAATVGMLNAVSVGVDTRHDFRSVTIRSHHAQSRLAAYIAPSRCILHRDDNSLVLWFDDSRKSETVHISEVRWLIFDPAKGEIAAYYVTFPPTFSDLLISMFNSEHPASSDWMALFDTYQANPLATMNSMKLIDGLTSATTYLDTGANALDARHVTFHMTFEIRTGEFDTIGSAAIRHHRQPLY